MKAALALAAFALAGSGCITAIDDCPKGATDASFQGTIPSGTTEWMEVGTFSIGDDGYTYRISFELHGESNMKIDGLGWDSGVKDPWIWDDARGWNSANQPRDARSVEFKSTGGGTYDVKIWDGDQFSSC